MVPGEGILRRPADPFARTAGHLVVRGDNGEQPQGNCTALDGAAGRGASLIGLLERVEKRSGETLDLLKGSRCLSKEEAHFPT